MLNYVNGDITAEKSGLIIHGVNAQGVMGSGVALAIRNRWPEVYEAYKTHKQGKDAMGKVQFVSIADGLYVGNCWTQEFYGNDGKVYADKVALRKAVLTAFEFCDDYELEMKTPKIASDRGGLDWETEVRPLFEQGKLMYPSVVVTVYVFEG